MENIESKVRKTIEKIRPMLQMDGGDVEIVNVKEGVVKVRLKGACHGCPMSQLTIQHGIEQTLKKEVDGIKRVETVD